MKKSKFFWLLLPLLLAGATVMHFASCDDSVTDDLKPNTETVAPATDDNAATNDDPTVTSRGFCAIEGSCGIDVSLVSGTLNLTICGINNGSTGCSFTTSCGEVYPAGDTFTSSPFSICVPGGRSFHVTNNTNASVTIALVIGGFTFNRTILANSSIDLVTNTACTDISNCP